ncbi:MAG TPA: cell division protein FtsZ, partial [Brevibacterium sp.]|nr:cell division protein FtsZ [Brevibacterium sp.]
FADVKSVMQNAGTALMGIGSATGEDRSVQAAEAAIASPLLEASIEGAHGVLFYVQGGSDLGIFEVNEAARLVQEAAHPEANIIFGAVIDDNIGDECRITVIAAGFDTPASETQDARPLGRAEERPAVAEAAYDDEPAAEETQEEAPAARPAQERSPDVPRSLPDETPTRYDNSDLDIPDFLK